MEQSAVLKQLHYQPDIGILEAHPIEAHNVFVVATSQNSNLSLKQAKVSGACWCFEHLDSNIMNAMHGPLENLHSITLNDVHMIHQDAQGSAGSCTACSCMCRAAEAIIDAAMPALFGMSKGRLDVHTGRRSMRRRSNQASILPTLAEFFGWQQCLPGHWTLLLASNFGQQVSEQCPLGLQLCGCRAIRGWECDASASWAASLATFVAWLLHASRLLV